MKLPECEFIQVVRSTPLISIDLVVKDTNGNYLLGQRTNRPAQGYWFVPGGRILKDESIKEAFIRLTMEELGVSIPESQAKFIGVFEHFYPDNFSDSAFSTHYVVLGYELLADINLDSLPKGQHTQYGWFSKDVLTVSENVHLHTKWYVQK
ncbi:GDP-mannose mannosyl hydrolase [Shewanella mangrovi]|uniref:GDP-mannose mannosyl hydrolase n=1 Tax=Shewanella mangrovi TaxID=1515746 RepID=A0A094JAF9_9GAMM|nr:GDP-mannose mannosyl hydrolase [Shewanella mangrovi]